MIDYRSIWEDGMSYDQYVGLIESLLDEGKSTSTDDPMMVEYSKLNLHRMRRVWKTSSIDTQGIAAASKKELFALIITEGWCGDAAQTVPIIVKFLESFGVNIRLVLRDQNVELIDAHLTNGGRSIPKLLIFDSSFSLLHEWGPRPTAAQDHFMELKAQNDPVLAKEEISKLLQLWYTKDKHASTLSELKMLMRA